MNTKLIAKLSPGRKKWCVLFRHPKLSDAAGKPRRVRYGIGTENREEADKIFSGLSAGGNIEVPIGDSPWGSYFGMFRDKFGIEWMVDFDPKHKGQI